MPKVTILVGAQWGDEGKGKWVDAIAASMDRSARYQGGNNAGHTLKVGQKTIVLHHLPSGILHKGHKAALLAGTVINPVQLLEEIAEVSPLQPINEGNLSISAKAHVITPWCIFQDSTQESTSSQPIGTTQKGIGPTYSEKSRRKGLRFSQFVNSTQRQAWIDMMCTEDQNFRQHFKQSSTQWGEFNSAADKLKAFASECEKELRQAVKNGESLLLEGAQGTLLDLEHGTYPYVTSSSTIASNACVSMAMDPRWVSNIYGISKAYVTRVGEGPFPTELKDEVGSYIADKGQEFGATTKRPRRCGWLDAVALRFACEINGLDGIYLNKIDVLTGLEQIALAVAYDHPDLGRIDSFPSNAEVLEQCVPVYEYFPGWKTQLEPNQKFTELPQSIQDFIQRIEAFTEVPIIKIGCGPGRNDFILR